MTTINDYLLLVTSIPGHLTFDIQEDYSYGYIHRLYGKSVFEGIVHVSIVFTVTRRRSLKALYGEHFLLSKI